MIGLNVFIVVRKKCYVCGVEPVIEGEFEVKFIFCFRLDVYSQRGYLSADFLKVGLEFDNSVAFKQESSGVPFFIFKEEEFWWGKCDSNYFDADADGDKFGWGCRKKESLVCWGWVIRDRGDFFDKDRVFDFELDYYFKDVIL